MTDGVKLEFIKYRVIGKPYRKWLAIVSEATGGQGESMFRVALYQGYNIRVDGPTADPMLFITQDTAQMRELRESGIINPTFYQLFLSTHVVALSEEEAIERMNAWMEANRE